MTFTTLSLILTGILLHLVVDWFFQDDWMAQNKMRWLKYGPHPAGIVHAAQHAFVMLLIFPWPVAYLIGFLHWIIDLRKPLIWWRSMMAQTTDPDNPAFMHVAIWQDQIAHVLVIVGVALLFA